MEPGHTEQHKQEILAGRRHCAERICAAWPGFLARRAERLAPHPLLGQAPEQVTESILEDLFTAVLDWPIASFNRQVRQLALEGGEASGGRADIVLSTQGVRWLIVEAKRPGSLAWNRRAVDRALDQAMRYAAGQRVRSVAVSDGRMLYAMDRGDGGLRDRVFARLGAAAPPLDLWWLSVQGIYRERELPEGTLLLPPEWPEPPSPGEGHSDVPQAADGRLEQAAAVVQLLHPKYKLPFRCFAYAPDESKPRTWKLPYLLADGSVDPKRLPKAIQCILTNYRGARVAGIPEQAIREVLRRLARAARRAGHLPPLAANPAPAYRQLAEALAQLKISVNEE